MWQTILASLRELSENWGKLPTGRKVGFTLIALLVICCVLGLGVWVGEKSYQPLYTNLQPENSIALVKILQEDRIPYLVSNEGGTISIPPEFIQPTLMKLAIRGVPGGQKPGMELFDKESFGTSSYVQRINYVRALQGELTRTINTLKPVKKSSIHISMPPKSSFLEQSEEPKASVVVELNAGDSLTRQEVKGIQNLVASSVESLRPERVTVVDHSGRALSVQGDAFAAFTSTMMERQQNVEKELERRVEDIVSRIMGEGNVVTRVNAELDFDPMKEQETIYDPDQTALKTQAKQENNMESSRPTPGGAPAGAQAALPGPASAAPESKQVVAKADDRSEFEVSSKVRSKEKAIGTVKRLSVAVLVNAETTTAEDGKETTKPISEEKRQTIEKLVKDAVGFVTGRDSVSIESSAFARENLDKADQMLVQRERRELIFSLIRYGTVGLFVLLFFSVVVRPFIRWVTGISQNKVESLLPKTVEELEQIQEPDTAALPGMANLPLLEEAVDLEKAENDMLRDKVVSMVELHPNKAAQIISEWLFVEQQAQQQGKKGRR